MWQMLAAALFQHELERQAAGRERQIEEQRERTARESAQKTMQMQAMIEKEAAERALIGRLPVPQLSGLMAEMYLPSSTALLSGPTAHVVQQGETLGIIATRYGVTVKDLFERNRGAQVSFGGVTRTLTSPDLIWPGLKLQLPTSTPSVPPAQPVAEPPAADPQPAPAPASGKKGGGWLVWGLVIAGGIYIAHDQKWI